MKLLKGQQYLPSDSQCEKTLDSEDIRASPEQRSKTSHSHVHLFGPSNLEAEKGSSEDGSIDKMKGPSKRERLRGLTSRTKTKTKRLLNLHEPHDDDVRTGQDEDDVLDHINADPAFNPSRLIKKKRLTTGGAAGKALGSIQTVAETVAHPIDSIKSKATRTTAGKLSQTERPYLSQKADLELLQAYVNLSHAESSGSSRHNTSDHEQASKEDGFRDKVQELEAHRESLRVAWTTSRHVDRVRVVPKRRMDFPDDHVFLEMDATGNFVRYKWERWLGYMLLYYTQDFSAQYIDDFDELPFDLDTLRHHVERLVMASAPWQAWAMAMRSVYRWESPARTGKWLALYLVLWYTQYIVAFVWAYILYLILANRYFPSTIEALRESTDRALNRGGTAYKFGELIDKHGRENWLEPLVDELGPYIQLQLSDVANMLEVFANFYAWKSPKKTLSSLCFFAACLAVSLFADMAFCMKVVSFIGGGAFFLCWPIASLYPKYRYLVSPFKWVLWDIPTDAEWSFQYLRRQAQNSREQMIKRMVEESYVDEMTNAGSHTYTGQVNVPKIVQTGPLGGSEAVSDASDREDEDWHSVGSSTSILESKDIIAFRAQWNHNIGRLVVYSSGIRFVRSMRKKEMWNRSFLDLVEMRKVQGSRASKLTMTALEQLEFTCTDGVILRIEAMKNRDEAFNTIIGFSGLQWQVLQGGPEKHGNGSDSGRKS